jgi:hypothetical protein
MVTKPATQLDGTPAQELLMQQNHAIMAVHLAISMLQEAAPNRRDCRPAASFNLALDEHLSRVARLETVMEELKEIARYLVGSTGISLPTDPR